MRKSWTLILTLFLLLAACSAEEKQTAFQVGETASTYWFEFALQSVETADRYAGHEAPRGSRLVLCQMSIESTFDGSVPMGQGDFILMWADPEDLGSQKAAFPLAQYTDSQLPDEYDMEEGEVWEGLLIYELPEEAVQAELMFEEQYVDGDNQSDYSVGDRYTVAFDVM